MNGVVAAGQLETAECAAEVLRAGGNAVDAAIAAAVAAFVAEPLLASAGGAGMMMVAAAEHEPTVIDFFSNMPGCGVAGIPEALDFAAIEVDFDAAMQEFHVGRGSAAVPGALPGLGEAHRRYATLPLADLVAPAQKLAREGVELSATTALVFRFLREILMRDPATLRAFTADGSCPGAGDRIVNPALADTLSEFAACGGMPASFSSGLSECFGVERGGLITSADIADYRPLVTAPRTIEVDGWRVHGVPAVGGRLVEVILRELIGGEPGADEADEVLRLARASRVGHEARQGLITPGSTTHISVVDGHHGVASVTLSNGEGCGHLIPGTGVQVNNFLGEEDLNPHGFHRHDPGVRLPTMMAPTVLEHDGQPVLALGSGGSNRIRTAIGQVLYRVMTLGQSLESAVRSPRVHAEGQTAWFETGGLADRAATEAALRGDYAEICVFEDLAFFFGGVHAVQIDEDGKPHGVGDRRRGGVALVV